MKRLILLVGTVAAAVLLDPQPGFARYEGPWCMHMSVGRGDVISRCDMRSYEMCRVEMGGLGGTYCTQNPWYRASAAEQPRRRKAKRRD